MFKTLLNCFKHAGFLSTYATRPQVSGLICILTLQFILGACVPRQDVPLSRTRSVSDGEPGQLGAPNEALDPPGCVLRYVDNAGGGTVPLFTAYQGRESVPLSEGTYVSALGVRDQGTWVKVCAGTLVGYMKNSHLSCDTQASQQNASAGGSDPSQPTCSAKDTSGQSSDSSTPKQPQNDPNAGRANTSQNTQSTASTGAATGAAMNSSVGLGRGAPQPGVAADPTGMGSDSPVLAQPQSASPSAAPTQTCKAVLPFFHWPGSWIDCKNGGNKVASFRPDSMVIVYLQREGDKFKLAAHPYCFFDSNNIDYQSCN